MLPPENCTCTDKTGMCRLILAFPALMYVLRLFLCVMCLSFPLSIARYRKKDFGCWLFLFFNKKVFATFLIVKKTKTKIKQILSICGHSLEASHPSI